MSASIPRGLFRFDPDSGECVQLVNYVDKPDVEDLDDGTQIFQIGRAHV